MDKKEISKKLDVIIASIVNHHNYTFSEKLKPEDISAWDSLANAMILTAIENEIGIKFKFSEMIAWHNMGQLVDLILKKIG